MIELTQYDMGKPVLLAANHDNRSMVIEIKLLDDRTVQLRVDGQGNVNLRGWGNKARRVGNVDQVGFHCQLMLEPATTCEVCYRNLGDCKCS